jgi:hypothetical protein
MKNSSLFVYGSTLGVTFASFAANAALDASISTSLTAAQTDIMALITLFYPVTVGVAAAFLIFRLVPKLIKRLA